MPRASARRPACESASTVPSPGCRFSLGRRRSCSRSAAKLSPTSSSTRTRNRRSSESKTALRLSRSRSPTTAAGSMRRPAVPATSGWSRCADARPRSTATWRSRARPEPGRSSGWRSVPMGPDGDRIRVVVVDDHAVVRSGLLAFLEGENDLEVVGVAEGGAEALDLLARLDSEGVRPDVVLMDLQMRPVDGIESTRMVRGRYDDVEVVALTSFGEPERVQRALEAGASGYLLKDADADEVAAAIRAAHRGELQLDAAVARPLMSTLQGGALVHSPAELTPRELDVVTLVGEGRANKEIARELGIGERTTRTHVSNILRKLGRTSRTQLALWAVGEGLVSAEASRGRPIANRPR